jgi:hypothetical protein
LQPALPNFRQQKLPALLRGALPNYSRQQKLPALLRGSQVLRRFEGIAAGVGTGTGGGPGSGGAMNTVGMGSNATLVGSGKGVTYGSSGGYRWYLLVNTAHDWIESTRHILCFSEREQRTLFSVAFQIKCWQKMVNQRIIYIASNELYLWERFDAYVGN